MQLGYGRWYDGEVFDTQRFAEGRAMSDSGASLASSTSSSLIRRVKARDPLAWERLAKLYGPLVYSWSRQAGLQASDAADVVQNVFQSVARGIEAFRRESDQDTFRGWLWTITRNQVRLYYRMRQGRPWASGGSTAANMLQQLPAVIEEDSEPAEGDATTSLAHRAMEIVRQEFEERTWQAFWRMTMEGHSVAEIAADLQMTPGAVRQAKYRVLVRLRELLDDG